MRDVMREVKGGLPHRAHRAAPRGRRPGRVPARPPTLAVLVIAGIEGLCLERIERGETADLRRARELFVRSIVAGLA